MDVTDVDQGTSIGMRGPAKANQSNQVSKEYIADRLGREQSLVVKVSHAISQECLQSTPHKYSDLARLERFCFS